MYAVERAISVSVENGTRKKHIDWVEAILRHTGWDQTTFARKIGRDPSAISKFRRGVNPGARLDAETIQRIADLKIIPPFQTEPPAKPRGFAEGEAEPYTAREADDDMLSRAIRAARADENALDPWVLRSRALELAGYLRGDVLMIDQNARPSEGDVVCAQIRVGTANPETVFRIYEPPFLVAVSNDTWLFKPILIDQTVQMRGVMKLSFRPQPPRRVA